MSNFKIFGSAIHDTALIFISTTTITSIILYFFDQNIDRMDANLCILFGVITSFLYWNKEYKSKK